MAAARSQLETILDNIDDVILRVSPDGTVLWASPSLRTLLGRDPDDVVGNPFSILTDVVPDEADQVISAALASFANNCTFRAPVNHRDGSLLWVEARVRLIWSPPEGVGEATLESMVLSIRDITDSVSAAAAADAAHIRMRGLLEAQFDPHIMARTIRDDEGVLLDMAMVEVNPALCLLMRRSRSEVLGRRLSDFLCPDSLIELLGLLEPVLRGDGELDVRGLELVPLRGGPRYLDLRGVRVGPNEVSISCHDVTSYKTLVAELDRSRAHYRTLISVLGTGIVVHGPYGEIVEANPAALQLLGVSLEQLEGRTPMPARWRVVLPDGSQVSCTEHPAAVTLRTGEPVRDTIVGVHRADRSLVWLLANADPIPDLDHDGWGALVSFSDITELVEYQREAAHRRAQLAASEAQYRMLAENASDVVFRTTARGRLEWVSPSVADLLGWQPEQLLGRGLTRRVHPQDRQALANALADPQADPMTMEARFQTSGGGVRWLAVTARNLRDPEGRITGRVGSCHDVTEAHEARESLRYLATHDSMTGLINRAEALDRLDGLLAHSPRAGAATAVLFADLDGLKAINDSLGHGAGDAAIIEVANRLTGAVRSQDTVARFGGDEFLILLPGVVRVEDLARIVAKIDRAMSAPLLHAGDSITVALSVGATIAQPGEDPELVVARADSAAYREKRRRQQAGQ